MIRALVFDFDGLILDTETPFEASWKEIYDEAGLAVSPAEWAALLGASADPPEAYALLERHVGQPVAHEQLRRRREAREAELLNREELLPGVRELIDVARRWGLRLAVASSSDRRWVLQHLDRFDLSSSFEAILCAEDVTHTKPSPDLYVVALRALGVRPCEAIAFEDSAHGTEAAHRAGIFVVAVPNRVTCHAPFPYADLVAPSLDSYALEDYIRAAEARTRKAGEANDGAD